MNHLYLQNPNGNIFYTDNPQFLSTGQSEYVTFHQQGGPGNVHGHQISGNMHDGNGEYLIDIQQHQHQQQQLQLLELSRQREREREEYEILLLQQRERDMLLLESQRRQQCNREFDGYQHLIEGQVQNQTFREEMNYDQAKAGLIVNHPHDLQQVVGPVPLVGKSVSSTNKYEHLADYEYQMHLYPGASSPTIRETNLDQVDSMDYNDAEIIKHRTANMALQNTATRMNDVITFVVDDAGINRGLKNRKISMEESEMSGIAVHSTVLKDEGEANTNPHVSPDCSSTGSLESNLRTNICTAVSVNTTDCESNDDHDINDICHWANCLLKLRNHDLNRSG